MIKTRKIEIVLISIIIFSVLYHIDIGYSATYRIVNIGYDANAPANTYKTINGTVQLIDGSLAKTSVEVLLSASQSIPPDSEPSIGGEVSNAGFFSFTVLYPKCTGVTPIPITITLSILNDASASIVVTVKNAYTVTLTPTFTGDQSCEPYSGKDVMINAKFIDTSTDGSPNPDIGQPALTIKDSYGATITAYSYTPAKSSTFSGEFVYTIDFSNIVTGIYTFTIFGTDSGRISIPSSISINLVSPHFYFKILVDGNDQNKYIGRDIVMQNIPQGSKRIDLYAVSSKYDPLPNVIIQEVLVGTPNSFSQSITTKVLQGAKNTTWWQFNVDLQTTSLTFTITASKTNYISLSSTEFKILTFSENIDIFQLLANPLILGIVALIVVVVVLLRRRGRSNQPVVMM